MSFRETLPSDRQTHELLAEYFSSRELGFTGEHGYTIVFPHDEQFVPPHGVFLVVENDGAGVGSGGVGCGGIRMIEPGTEGAVRFEVKHVWVDPLARGAGLGRRILAELERRAIEFGASEAVLDTNASLEAAAGLYRSSGYHEVAPYNDNPNATNWYAKAL